MKKMVNGVYVDITAEEKIVTDRASAKTKLKTLGLTDDELKAAFRL